MNIIRELPQDVVEKIAAGEVIERPANLVKELIENSIDANATEIEIEVQSGGRNIIVTDNGHGIRSKEIALALKRHTTSKISLAEDLWKLKSFGFRGEALASIAAVSDLTLTSREKDSKKANQIHAQFGEIGTVVETGFQQGTQVRIDRLFENVPARLKFLKSDTAELTQIKKTVKAVALAHADVGFRVKNNGELVAYWPATKNFLKRAEQILEKKMYVAEDHQVRVAFTSPHDVQKTSGDIWIFVQNRWVQDKTIQAAILDAYRTLLMHGEYPSVVIDLKISPEDVDVNVHPAKSQVKFVNSSNIFRAVHGLLRRSLETAPWMAELGLADKQTHDASGALEKNIAYQESFLSTPATLYPQKQNFVQSPVLTYQAVESVSDELASKTNFEMQNQETNADEAKPFISPPKFWSQTQVIGQAQLTYMIAQSRHSLFLIDQHAAHERIIFEKLMESFRQKSFEIQDFLIPLTLDMEKEKCEALLSTKEELSQIGIQVDSLGVDSVAVRSAPAILKDAGLSMALHEWADEVSKGQKSFSLEKAVAHIFATMACHSVVRAGQALSNEEIKSLLEQMDEFPLSGYCPHGRPVYMEYRFSELDRSFGRIL